MSPSLDCGSTDYHNRWTNFWGADHTLEQWRWDHDRPSAITRDTSRASVESTRRQEEEKLRREYLSQITLAELQARRFFDSWKSYPKKSLVLASRKIMSQTVENLVELGPTASQADRIAILRACIEAFNRLDAETSFIETVEREEICEEFEAIVHACGLGSHGDLADEWREW